MRLQTKLSLLFSSLLLILFGCDSPNQNNGTDHSSAPSTHSKLGQKASFDAKHEIVVKVPSGAKKVRVWLATPQDVPQQKVSSLKVECSFPHRVETAADGNKYIYVEAENPTVAEFPVVATFRIDRQEVLTNVDPKNTRPLTDEEKKKMAPYLEPTTYAIIDDRIRQVSKEVVGDEKNPIVAARKIYDWELGYVDYWVIDPDNKKASKTGSTDHCYSTKTGNCTDFHALWTSVAQASGVPTRMVYGSFFKKELDGVDKDQSYHCWPEFYAPGIGWVPHDVAVADLFSQEISLNEKNKTLVQLTTAAGYSGKDMNMVNFYFGNLDNRRVTWSIGRDLTLAPKQDGGKVNMMARAYVEADGKELTDYTRKLTYKEVK